MADPVTTETGAKIAEMAARAAAAQAARDAVDRVRERANAKREAERTDMGKQNDKPVEIASAPKTAGVLVGYRNHGGERYALLEQANSVKAVPVTPALEHARLRGQAIQVDRDLPAQNPAHLRVIDPPPKMAQIQKDHARETQQRTRQNDGGREL